MEALVLKALHVFWQRGWISVRAAVGTGVGQAVAAVVMVAHLCIPAAQHS